MTFAAATFALCLVLMLGAYWLLVVRPEQQRTKAVTGRLRQVDGPRNSDLVTEAPRRMSSIPALEGLLVRHGGRAGSWLEQQLIEADLKASVGVFLMACMLGAAVGWTVGMMVLELLAAGLVLAAIGAFVPLLVVRIKRSKRLRLFEEQFPEAIDLIARALRAGHAFTTGLGMAADETPAPVGKEFKRIYDEQNFGMSLPDALRAMAGRVPVLDARFFVTAVLTQRESGGNLAEVLDNLSSVMRERFKVKRQIRVISAHGRLSAWVLSLLPPSMAAVLFALSPSFMRVLIDDPLGLQLVFVAVFLQLLGSYIVSRLVKIEY
jgi:tight adherence protein B